MIRGSRRFSPHTPKVQHQAHFSIDAQRAAWHRADKLLHRGRGCVLARPLPRHRHRSGGVINGDDVRGSSGTDARYHSRFADLPRCLAAGTGLAAEAGQVQVVCNPTGRATGAWAIKCCSVLPQYAVEGFHGDGGTGKVTCKTATQQQPGVADQAN